MGIRGVLEMKFGSSEAFIWASHLWQVGAPSMSHPGQSAAVGHHYHFSQSRLFLLQGSDAALGNHLPAR